MAVPIPNTPSMAEHTDVLLYLLGVCIVAITGFVGLSYRGLQKTLTKIDSRQEKTEIKVDEIDGRVTVLETEHKLLCGKKVGVM